MPTGVEQAPLSRPPRAGDVGNVVDALPGAGPDGTPYAAFVAPALLATSAMNRAVNETTGGVWWRLKFERFYDSILATPLGVTDIAVGEVSAAVPRSVVASTCFFDVIAALGLVQSWWAALVVPPAVLIGKFGPELTEYVPFSLVLTAVPRRVLLDDAAAIENKVMGLARRHRVDHCPRW